MLGDMETQIDLKLVEIGVSTAQQPDLREMTQELLQDQRQYLDNLMADYDACLQVLGELDISVRSLEQTADQFRDYVDERVLWIRSSQPLNVRIFSETWQAIQQFWSSDDWPRLVLFLMEDIGTAWPQYLLGVLLLLGITGSQSRLRALSTRLISERQKQGASLLPVMCITLGITVLTACAWPLIPGFAAWRLQHSDAPLAASLERGFAYWGSALLVLDFSAVCVVVAAWRKRVWSGRRKSAAVCTTVCRPTSSRDCPSASAWWYRMNSVTGSVQNHWAGWRFWCGVPCWCIC